MDRIIEQTLEVGFGIVLIINRLKRVMSAKDFKDHINNLPTNEKEIWEIYLASKKEVSKLGRRHA